MVKVVNAQGKLEVTVGGGSGSRRLSSAQFDTLSNAVSVVSAKASVLSNAVSVLSQAVSVVSVAAAAADTHAAAASAAATSVDARLNTASNLISALTSAHNVKQLSQRE